VKLAVPAGSATGSLNVPVITVVFVDTLVAETPGVELMTMGRATATSPPRMWSLPPHPTTTRHANRANPLARLKGSWNSFIALLGTNLKTLEAEREREFQIHEDLRKRLLPWWCA
jgi:hypothetical protein